MRTIFQVCRTWQCNNEMELTLFLEFSLLMELILLLMSLKISAKLREWLFDNTDLSCEILWSSGTVCWQILNNLVKIQKLGSWRSDTKIIFERASNDVKCKSHREYVSWRDHFARKSKYISDKLLLGNTKKVRQF